MNEIINQLFKSTHMENGKNMFEKLLTFLKNCTYDLFYVLLKKQDNNFFVELVSICFQMLQLLSFSFHSLVLYIINYNIIIHSSSTCGRTTQSTLK